MDHAPGAGMSWWQDLIEKTYALHVAKRREEAAGHEQVMAESRSRLRAERRERALVMANAAGAPWFL